MSGNPTTRELAELNALRAALIAARSSAWAIQNEHIAWYAIEGADMIWSLSKLPPIARPPEAGMRQLKASSLSLPLFFSMFLLASTASAPSLQAQAQSAVPAAAANENYMFCYTTTQGASIVYFSDIFNAGPPSGPHGRQGAALGQLFVAFLQKKYGLTSSDHANCAGPSTAGLENAQAYKQVMEDQTKQANKQIVETGWKNQ